MQKIIQAGALAGVIALCVPANAQNRPDSLDMSCAQAQALVRHYGAVVVSTGPNLYERYVTGQNFCSREEEARPAWVETADRAQCQIGLRCVTISLDVR